MAMGYNEYGDWGYIPDDEVDPAAPVNQRNTSFNPAPVAPAGLPALVTPAPTPTPAPILAPAPAPAPTADGMDPILGKYKQADIDRWNSLDPNGPVPTDPKYTEFVNDTEYWNKALSTPEAQKAIADIASSISSAPGFTVAGNTEYGKPVAFGGWDPYEKHSGNDLNYWNTNKATVSSAPQSLIDQAKAANGQPVAFGQGGVGDSTGYVWKDGALHQTQWVHNTGTGLAGAAPFILNMIAPGAGTAIGSALDVGATLAPIVGGAILGGGSAALTGGDIGKGALMGGLGSAGNIGIGDTGATVGQVTSAVNLVKNLESGNLIGAITGAANLNGMGNTQIGETGFTLNDLSKDLNLAKAVISGNPSAVMSAVTSVANSAAKSEADANNAINPYFQTGAGTGQLPTNYATNDVGTQQLIDALTNTPAFSGPSVNVASSDDASALIALQDKIAQQKVLNGEITDLGEVSNKTPDETQPAQLGVTTEEENQKASDDLAAALNEIQQPTPETPSSNDYLQELIDSQQPPDKTEIEQRTQELLAQLQSPAQPVEKPTAPTEPTDAVQALLDSQQPAPTNQAEIDQQTQDLLNYLSGGTNNGTSDNGTPANDQAEWDVPVNPNDLNTALTEIAAPEPNDTPSPTEQDVLDFMKEHPDAVAGTATRVAAGKAVAAKTAAAKAASDKATADKAAADKAVADKAAASVPVQQYMPSVGDVAHIKYLESLFGPLLGTLPAEPAHEKKDDSLSALEGMDQEYANGGHVDDFDVDALLHILRS